ncbi:MAG: acyl carrier protein [gamma proteobacterium endosymbiont of Lamellibrachia anaximandri]|nr:acyl carrier protein [gamma proteobacterium endosymbiont of Lamellibrachia anaximandri]MBL3534233.1 acyl carrier protein [gamma proteobacterium endosymbiont of Lamellibrachia anaximandri]MBL3599815.1 acyl carrier protein [gamma proteobacterium endosymbiont of Lamellibrachia anaximandri]
MDIETVVISAIATQKQLDTANIKRESRLQDLGVSSLDAITIVYEVEEAFDVEIPNAELEKLETVGDIVDGIGSLLAGK